MIIRQPDLNILKATAVNSQLTKLIISYHERGYTEDFYVDNLSRRLYIQGNRSYHCSSYVIAVISQCYDSLTKDFKYIHTIETFCGIRGLLISTELQFSR